MATQAIADAKIDMGRIIQRGFETFGRRISVLAILALIFIAAPAVLVGLVVAPNANAALTDPNAMMAIVYSPAFWLTILVAVICSVLLQAAVVRASILHLQGQTVDVASNITAALKLVLPLIALSILTFLAVGIASMLLLVPGIIVFLMLIVAAPVLIAEGKGVIESMTRSAELTKGSKWRILGLCAIYLIINWILSIVINLVTVPLVLSAPVVGLLVQSVLNSLVSLIGAVMVASLYVELRMVKEGVSEQGLAAIFS